jgi:hypothetical protein
MLSAEAVGLRHAMGATSAPRSHRAHAQVDQRSVSFWVGFWMGAGICQQKNTVTPER